MALFSGRLAAAIAKQLSATAPQVCSFTNYQIYENAFGRDFMSIV